MEFFWYFVAYSFLGYLLERAFAVLTRAENRVRKCFLILPLCPVYGLAMTAMLLLGAQEIEGFWGRWLFCTVIATAVEYLTHFFYEAVFAVQFWDYSDTKLDWNGRVCLPFSLAWGFLSVLALFAIQPMLARFVGKLSAPFTLSSIFFLAIDALYTARVLYLSHDVELLGYRTLLSRERD